MNAPQSTAAHPLRGLALFLVCLFLFACLDTTTKYLAETYQVPVITATRYAVNLLLMLAVVAPRHGRQMVTIHRRRWVFVRALALSVASISLGLALARMPIAETSAILFFSPVVVILVAGPMLGETVGRSTFLAAAIGFVGVLLIVRPGGGLDPAGVALAGTAMLANAAYQLLSRKLAASEQTIALLFYTTLTGTVIFGLLAPWFLADHAPTSFELLLFASLGIYGGLGHFLFTAAYRDTPASLLASLNYAQLIFVGVLGWLVFGDLPDAISLIGMAVIILSGIIVALRRRTPPVKRSV